MLVNPEMLKQALLQKRSAAQRDMLPARNPAEEFVAPMNHYAPEAPRLNGVQLSNPDQLGEGLPRFKSGINESIPVQDDQEILQMMKENEMRDMVNRYRNSGRNPAGDIELNETQLPTTHKRTFVDPGVKIGVDAPSYSTELVPDKELTPEDIEAYRQAMLRK